LSWGSGPRQCFTTTTDTPGAVSSTTYQGGNSGLGVVFKLDTTGKETVLHSFTGGSDGGNPGTALLPDGTGNFYGATSAGGLFSPNCTSGCGVVFKLTP
jgi:uncharacterized repeat protein (TIGR03803 family)